MGPIIVVQVVSIDSLQQQVRNFRCEVRQVRVFLWVGGSRPPPHVENLYQYPPWGLYVSVPFIVILFSILFLCLEPSLYGLVALVLLVLDSGGEGYCLVSLCRHSCPRLILLHSCRYLPPPPIP